MKVFKFIGLIMINTVYLYHFPLKSKMDVAIFILLTCGMTFYVQASIDEE